MFSKLWSVMALMSTYIAVRVSCKMPADLEHSSQGSHEWEREKGGAMPESNRIPVHWKFPKWFLDFSPNSKITFYLCVKNSNSIFQYRNSLSRIMRWDKGLPMQITGWTLMQISSLSWRALLIFIFLHQIVKWLFLLILKSFCFEGYIKIIFYAYGHLQLITLVS